MVSVTVEEGWEECSRRPCSRTGNRRETDAHWAGPAASPRSYTSAVTGSSHMRVPDRDQLIEVIERWHQSFSESGGKRAADAEHSAATEAMRRVVSLFIECALPRIGPPKPDGLSDDAYAIARSSRRVFLELDGDGGKDDHLWDRLDRLLRSARYGFKRLLPRLCLTSDALQEALRLDPIAFVFARIRQAGWAALKHQMRREIPVSTMPEVDHKNQKPIEIQDARWEVPSALRRHEMSKDFVALPRADTLSLRLGTDNRLRSLLGLLLMRETAKYTEFRHDAKLCADLPVHGVHGITVGMWLAALESHPEVTAIDKELGRRWDDAAGPSQTRVDGLSSVLVLEMLHELAAQCGTTCPWKTPNALDAAVLRAKKAVMKHCGHLSPAGKQP